MTCITRKYMCIGDDCMYGTIVVGEGDTLSKAYEHYKNSCLEFGGECFDADNCSFYLTAPVNALALKVDINLYISESAEKIPKFKKS